MSYRKITNLVFTVELKNGNILMVLCRLIPHRAHNRITLHGVEREKWLHIRPLIVPSQQTSKFFNPVYEIFSSSYVLKKSYLVETFWTFIIAVEVWSNLMQIFYLPT